MTFLGLLASWFLLVKMICSSLQPLVLRQGDSSPQPRRVSRWGAWPHLSSSLPSLRAGSPPVTSPPPLPTVEHTCYWALPCAKNTLVALSCVICTPGLSSGCHCLRGREKTEALGCQQLDEGQWQTQDTTPVLSGSKSRLHPLSGSLEPLLLCLVTNLLPTWAFSELS